MKRHGSELFERIARAEAQGDEDDFSSGIGDMEEEHPAVTLGGHLKTGQLWTGQNRPVGHRPKQESSTAVDRP
jgi:hypothetical protein